MLRPSRVIGVVAFIALLGMMGVTLVDIALRLLSRMPDHPLGGILPPAVPGVVDLVQLSLVAVAHLSIAVTFMLGTHVTVDVIAGTMPARARGVVRRLGWAVSFAFMALCFLQAFEQGWAQYDSGLVSATISLPLWWYWVPVVVGTALAALACLAHLFGRRLSERKR